jgi:peptidoglycan-N-acetylglucosamine deacetylase
MWFASGIAWDANGWDLEVVDAEGQQVMPPRRYGAAERSALLADVMELRQDLGRPGSQLAVVVDSTNGLIDRWLVEAGVEVHRADPGVLPPRTRMGSVPARALARAASSRLSSLTQLGMWSGTMHGREAEAATAAEGSWDLEARLTEEGRYVTRGPDDEPQVALTFDDGPDPRNTSRVLDELERYGVRATFFCVGAAARAYPDVLERAAGEGHLIANHTWSHPFVPDLTREELRWQVEATGAALTAAVGEYAEPALVRPPYGLYSPQALSWLDENDATLVLWDVDTADWMQPGPEVIVEQAVEGAENGSIVLFHDGGGDRSQTAEALPEIIEELLGRGFELVTVTELIGAD